MSKNNPCKDCIALPKYIQKYEEGHLNRLSILTDNCSTLLDFIFLNKYNFSKRYKTVDNYYIELKKQLRNEKT